MKCIICHMEIIDGLDSFEQCPNGHLVHEECFKSWIMQSLNCPLCSEPYSKSVIQKYKVFLERKVKEKQDAIIDDINRERTQKIVKIAEKMVILKFIESIDSLIEKKDYNTALDRISAVYDKDALASDFKTQTILFLHGKIDFLRERYDLAINFLFKLVKQKYDYPDAFLYLGKAYEKIGLVDKARWAFDRVT
ncbi:MAG: RING finger domain-containing protein [Promethearchaeota archaeon]